MAPISDFQLTLVDGVLNLSTTDTRFHDSENQIYLELKNVPYTTGTGQYLGFSSDGTQSYQLPDYFNLPLNIQITINDDDNPSIESYNDSEFYYNINTTNVLSEGKYLDPTATDRVVFSIDESTVAIQNVNGENFLNISGKIENYQSLVSAHGQLNKIELIDFEVRNGDYPTNEYDFNIHSREPVDSNNASDLLDLSIAIPDYIPNGKINLSNINPQFSFENNWLSSDTVTTGSIDYEGRIGSDIIDPSINSLTYSQGARDYPSIIIDGNITDDIDLDYAVFEIKWPKTNGFNEYETFMLPSNAIEENGNFSIEYTPRDWYWDQVNGDLFINAAMAFDSSNNYTLYNNEAISGWFEAGNETWLPVFYEEYEYNDTEEWYFRFNFDKSSISNGHLFDVNQNGGSYANLTDEDVSFNGIDIPAKTIINPDGSIVQPSDNFFNNNNNSYDASEIRIISSLGNDYVNLSGSQQNIQVKWSPGNDTFIFDLNEEKNWQKP